MNFYSPKATTPSLGSECFPTKRRKPSGNHVSSITRSFDWNVRLGHPVSFPFPLAPVSIIRVAPKSKPSTRVCIAPKWQKCFSDRPANVINPLRCVRFHRHQRPTEQGRTRAVELITRNRFCVELILANRIVHIRTVIG